MGHGCLGRSAIWVKNLAKANTNNNMTPKASADVKVENGEY
jgi:hypothetical protein